MKVTTQRRRLLMAAGIMVMVAGGCAASGPGGVAVSDTGGDTGLAESAAGDASGSASDDTDASGSSSGGVAEGEGASDHAVAALQEASGVAAEGGLDPDVSQAVFDTRLEGEIEQVFGVDRWEFEAQEDQLVTLDVHAVNVGVDGCNQDLWAHLVHPNGDRFEIDWIGAGVCQGYGPFRLEEAGTWAVEFVGGDGAVIDVKTGGYSFVLSFLTEYDVGDITFGARQEGEIEQVFGVDRWEFEAQEDQLVTLDVHAVNVGVDGCNQDLWAHLVDPNGDRFEIDWIGAGGCQAYGPFRLEEAGTWAVEFVGGDGAVIDVKTGGYSFTAQLS